MSPQKGKEERGGASRCLLHYESGGARFVLQVPPKSQISSRLRGEDKQISGRNEEEVQRDEVSQLSRADDADTSRCDPRDNGRARP